MTARVNDELVDIVDDADRVIRTVPRRTMRRDNLQHRVVFIVVWSSTGAVLVHRRSDSKDVWPGFWDLAVGGVVAAGEWYDTAARRELNEELGIDADPVELGTGRYEDADVRLVGRVYRVVHDGPFTFADGEVVEGRFVSRDELPAMVERQRFVPDSVALVMPHL